METSGEPVKKKKKSSSSGFSKKAKVTLIEWLTTSTTHALPNIGKTNSQLIRVVWILAFLGAAIYCLYSIIFLIVEFFAYEVIVNLVISDSTPTDFPAVTFCNLNPFDHTLSQSYIDATLARYNLSYVNNVTQIDMNPETVKYLLKANMAADKLLSRETLKSFGYSFNATLLSCYFNNELCDESDFVWMYDFSFGNCYTFNSGYDSSGNRVPIKKISEDGTDHSFRLEIFLGNELTQNAYMLQSGARVVIHNQTYRPSIISEAVELSTNYMTNIGVVRSFYYKLSDPYSDCVKDANSVNGHDSPYYKAMFTILNVTSYRQKDCFDFCQQDFIKQKCKCMDASLPSISDTDTYPICTNLSAVMCVSSARTNYSLYVSDCNQCPLECNTVSYYLQTSRSRYPTTYYTSYLQKHTDIVTRFPPGTTLNDNYIQKNTLVMNIYYVDLSVSNVVEMPSITFDYLMGNVGGYLGLFVGMSLLSLVEFIEITVNLILIWLDLHHLSIKRIRPAFSGLRNKF